MGIFGDTMYDLLGFTDPRKKLAASLAAPQGAAPAPAPAVPMGHGGIGSDAAADPNSVPAAPPQAPPQPQAYTSPPDFTKMYMDLLNRQEGSAAIDRGMGLLFAGFAQPQDRAGMVNAMSQGAYKDPGAMIAELQTAQIQQGKIDSRMQLLRNASALAQQLKMPIEQVIAAINSGAMDNIIQEHDKATILQGSPLYGAQVASTTTEANLHNAQIAKEQADQALSEAKTKGVPSEIAKAQADANAANANADKARAEANAIPGKIAETAATTAKTTAETAAIPTKTALEEAQTKEALAKANAPTPELQNYNFSVQQFKADPQNAGKEPPSFTEWQAQNAGLREAATQSNLIQTQQKLNAQNQLPDVTDKIVKQLDNIDEILKPGNLEKVTGSNIIGRAKTYVPNTAEKDLQERIDQMRGSTGVAAVESLRGVGRVLGTEFTAGTEAQGRVADQGQSTAAYRQAVIDLRNSYAKQLATVYTRAGLPIPAELQAKLSVIGGGTGDKPTKKVIRNSKGELELQQ